ncbi:MAG: hypothetical protein IT426_08625 [Pirellulales bacterium]|nr:hypothetical protein [Pirellulales bacterium]
MTAKEFLNAVSHAEADILQILLDILAETQTSYCVIGGLAVNAYVEPVVSLDLDIVVVAQNIDAVCRGAESRGLRVESFPHRINLHGERSDLRVQIHTDPRYQEFLPHAEKHTILGYEISVAGMKEVLLGKTWAYRDETRRKSKRQKDLADILRLVEAYPDLLSLLPESMRKEIE